MKKKVRAKSTCDDDLTPIGKTGPAPEERPGPLSPDFRDLRRGQDELRHEVESLREQLYLLGHLVEKVSVDVRRYSILRLVGDIIGFIFDCLRALAHPVVLARRVSAAARRTKPLVMRPVWREGRWVKQLSGKACADVWRASKLASFIGFKQPVLYEVRQRLPVMENRKRILHAIPNVYVGGSTQLVVDLFDHLGHKYEMHVVTSALPPHGRHVGMDIFRQAWADSAAFMVLLRRRKPDLLHVHYWGDIDKPWYDALFDAAKAVGCRTIQNINTPVMPHESPVVLSNIFVSNAARAVGGDCDTPGRVIYPGIDMELYKPPATLDSRAADSIGMVYRLDRDKLNEKSILPLIEAVTRRRRTRVFVIGGGALFESYVQAVEQNGVSDNFVFTGYVPYKDLPFWYSQFQIFMAPVWQESFGQVVPFAMAMGLTVAGNRVGALPEILESDETLGTSAEETATKLIDLLEDPERVERLGQRNRQIALRRFALPPMIAAYDAAYSEALQFPAQK